MLWRLKGYSSSEEYAEFKKWEELRKGFSVIDHDVKRKILGYEPDEMFGFFDLQFRYFHWRTEVYPRTDRDKKPKELFIMGRAVESLIPAAQRYTFNNPAPEETAFMEQTTTLWGLFHSQTVNTLDTKFDKERLTAAIEIFFSHVSEPASREIIVDPYHFSHVNFALELTYLFHANREQCSTLEQAIQFDWAYEQLFYNDLKSGRLEISYADHPYSAALNGTLKKPLPLPGVETELTVPLVNAGGETMFEGIKKMVGDAMDLSDRYSEVKETRVFNRCATTTDARKCFGYEPRERFTFEDLQERAAQWKNENPEEFKENRSIFMRAYYLLAGEARATTRERQTSEDSIEARRLWALVPEQFATMSHQEAEAAACELFASHCGVQPVIIKEMFPIELTNLFQQHRESCSTLEMARQFDDAYSRLFRQNYNRLHNPNYDWEWFIDTPYSPVLAKRLAPPLPVDVPEPVIAEVPQEELIEAPAPSVKEYVLKPVEPVKVNSMLATALGVFGLTESQLTSVDELREHYNRKIVATDPDLAGGVIEAYDILKAEIENSQNEVAYQEERTLFGFGLTDTITKIQLDDRYEEASEKTDSKAEQKVLDEAYQVLLKIAA